jgi:2-phosphosulfolactate phosphatase
MKDTQLSDKSERLAAARDRFAPPPRIHVVVKKEDLDPSRLEGRAVVVLDILFATTTIVTALDAGATAVHFALDQHEARRIASSLPAGEFHIAGEDHLAAIPGFASPLPIELSRRPGFAGKPLVYSTTNGTVALRRAQGAAVVYAASLRNAGATLAHVARHHRDRALVIVCAGSAGTLNLEDFYAAGCFVARLTPMVDATRDLSDTALAALAAFRASDAWSALSRSRVGRIVLGVGGDDEVRHAAEIDASTLVAIVEGDRVIEAQDDAD